MKCFVSLYVLFPLVAQYAVALSVPEGALVARQQDEFVGNNLAKSGGNGGGSGKGSSTQSSNNAGNTATGNNSGGSGNVQTSLTLDPSVIAPNFAKGQPVNAGEAQSLQSTNNFINFCVGKTITNGQQVTAGSCNPAPMGDIPSTSNMPSSKFTFPKNFDTIAANTKFTISMAIRGMQTGDFTNAAASYFAAPQQLNAQGQINGHSHVVVEQLSAIDQTTPTDPSKFAFFLGLNAAAKNGVLTADVSKGLPAGVYKLSSINTAANHQPLLVPIAQHGSLDDAVYFTVTANGKAAGNTGNAGGVSGSSTPPATASPSSVGKGGGSAGGKGAGGSNGGASGNTSNSSSATLPPTSSPTSGKGGANGKGAGGSNGGASGNTSNSSSATLPPTSSPTSGKGGANGKGAGGSNGGASGNNSSSGSKSPPAASSPSSVGNGGAGGKGAGGSNGGSSAAAPSPSSTGGANGTGGKKSNKRRFLADY